MKKLTVTELKVAIFKRFDVSSVEALKQCGSFRGATVGMVRTYYEEIQGGEWRLPPLDFKIHFADQKSRYELVFSKATWEYLYRKFVGILPHEENLEGDYWCVNGINIFYYFKPWQVFGLDPRTATAAEIEEAYTELAIFMIHMDADAAVIKRLESMFKSISIISKL